MSEQMLITERAAADILAKFQDVERRLAARLDAQSNEQLTEVRASIATLKDNVAAIRKTSIGSNFVLMDPSRPESRDCYSIFRALKLDAKKKLSRVNQAYASEINTSDCGYEMEVHKTLEAQGAYEVVSKAQQHVGTNQAGGVLVPREASNEVIMDLKPMSVAMRAGVMTIPGVSGILSIPKKTSAITGETLNTELPGALTPQTVTFGDVELRPRPFGALTKISYLTMRQTAPAMEAILRQEFLTQLALQVDLHVFKGSGQGGQPLGVAKIPTADGLNTKSWSGAVFGSSAGSGGQTTYDDSLRLLREMYHECRKDNALVGSSPAWVGEVDVALKFETALTRSGHPMYLPPTPGPASEQPAAGERLLRFPAWWTTNLANASASDAFFLFGVFSNVIHPIWGGIQFDVSDSDGTDFRSGVLALRAIGAHDVAVRYPESFCLATSFDAS